MMAYNYEFSSDISLDAYIYNVPLTHKFRGITQRSGVLLHGSAGWAEVSPFWDYGVEYSSRWLLGAVDAAVNGYPQSLRDSIPVNVTIPAVDAETAYDIARSGGGAHTAKVKIAEPGQTLADDCARLEAVRSALGSSAHIRVDANGKWDVSTAITAIEELDRSANGLEYVEQPCASVEELAQVRRAVNVPIAADESIRRAEDPFHVVKLGAADVVILKNQPLGGVRAALALAELLPLPAVVSSALESSIGLYAGLRFAAALPNLSHACGLATAKLFIDDVCADSLLPSSGEIIIREVTPDLSSVAVTRLTPQLKAAWMLRFSAMWDYAVEMGDLPRDAHYTFPAL